MVAIAAAPMVSIRRATIAKPQPELAPIPSERVVTANRDYRSPSRVQDFALRASKHGFIWLVLLLAFVPLVLMVIVSFKSNTQFYEAPATITRPLHVENWSTAWSSVAPTLANSVFISTLGTALTLALALGAAYFFVRLRMPMSGFLWNAIVVLMMMPAIANLVPLFCLLRDLNLLNTLSALILVGASGGQMFAIFVLRNFVSDIPRDMFEAAEIDGASHWQQLKVIVAPLSGPILGTVGVMQFVTLWNDFVLPLIILRDHEHLPVMVQLLRMSGEYLKLWGPLMAGYAIASIPIIVLFIFSMKLFVRGLSEGAVKG
jgi:ABC-type glycerol-3-phosphate transport system permease component